MVSHPLTGAYAKLDRARVHARDLQQMIDGLLDPDGHRFVPEPDGEPTKLLFRVQGLPKVGPEIGAAFGDFLNNTRAALDHLAWQLVPDTASIKMDAPENIQFPILESEFSAKGNLRPAVIQGVTDAAVLQAVDAVQPYKRAAGQLRDADPLRVLNLLANIDKHRSLHLTFAGLNLDAIWWGSDEGDPTPGCRLAFGPLEDNQPVAWFDFGEREPSPNFDPHFSLEIRLAEPLPGLWDTTHISVPNLVQMLYNEVEHQVLSRYFAPIFGLPPRHGMTATWP